MEAILVEVAVDAPSLRGPTLTYRVPAELAEAAVVGRVVWVPIRRQWRLGIIIDVSTAVPDYPVRDIHAMAEPSLCLSADELARGQWLSRRYHCGLFDALRPMLPPGATHRAVVAWQLARPLSPAELDALPPRQRRLVDLISDEGRVSQVRARDALPGVDVAAAARPLESAGVLVRVVSLHEGTPTRRSEQRLTGMPTTARLTPKQRQAHDILLRHAPRSVPAADVLRQAGVSQSVLTALVRGGHATVTTAPIAAPRQPLPDHHPAPELSPAQSAAWTAIGAAIDSQRYQPLLLHGVTGSGKTELYLRAVAGALRQGRGCILLAPEIALATQLVERVSDRFPGQVAVLHSGLRDADRYEQWQLVREGQRRVVVGPRSALFAPLTNLGLIVLDEEHDAAYKQDAPPRFHARAYADYLARQAGATVLFGSATPDVVTSFAARRGLVRELVLPNRVAAGSAGANGTLPLPPVEIVDMRRELREGNTSLFSRSLRAAVNRTLNADDQALLFLNRRGDATIVLCRACGHVALCDDCDVPLVYHRVGERLICHRCGARRSPPSTCPACTSPKIRYLGAGTQRVESEVAALWPTARVVRWDQDVISRTRSHADLLRQVRKHDVDIVVGTQMIAKGLDLPRVMTVGVITADTVLHLPDFRSAERTYQMLAQVAGRAGRRAPGSSVIIQSYTPEHYCLQAAAAHDYEAFYQEEIEFRRAHRYPPFARLVQFEFGHRDELTCQREATAFAEHVAEVGERRGVADFDVIGPAPCFARRLRGKFRWQVVIRAHSLTEVLDDILVPPGWTVDVDPASLL